LYCMIPFILYYILKTKEGIAMTNIIWNIASMIYGLFIGVILFNENILLKQKIGIILGFIGLILMISTYD
jgi:drug/metabolite transporter (DMT)-like permease